MISLAFLSIAYFVGGTLVLSSGYKILAMRRSYFFMVTQFILMAVLLSILASYTALPGHLSVISFIGFMGIALAVGATTALTVRARCEDGGLGMIATVIMFASPLLALPLFFRPGNQILPADLRWGAKKHLTPKKHIKWAMVSFGLMVMVASTSIGAKIVTSVMIYALSKNILATGGHSEARGSTLRLHAPAPQDVNLPAAEWEARETLKACSSAQAQTIIGMGGEIEISVTDRNQQTSTLLVSRRTCQFR